MDNYQTHLYETDNLIIKYLVNLRIRNILKCLDKKDNVLEAGCGDGYLSGKIAERVNTLVSVDISYDRIKKAKKLINRPNVKFLKKDITNMNLRQKYNKIICSEVLEHIQDYKLAIKNLSKHLEKSGQLIITVPNETLLRIGRTLLFGKRAKELEKKTNHIYVIKHKDIKKISNELNLKIINYKPLPFPILNLNKLFVLKKLI